MRSSGGSRTAGRRRLILLFPCCPSIPGLCALRPQSEPAATGDYLRGNRDYDGPIWGSLNGDAQTAPAERKAAHSRICSGRWKRLGRTAIKLEEISYVGGKVLPDGTSVQFYLVGVRQQARADLDYQPYMFTLDRDGKIAKVQ